LTFLSISPRWQKIRNGDRSCAENVDLSHCGIAHGKCIDHALIKNLFGLTLNGRKDIGQRDDCGCIKSVDIGMYNTCLHGCSYCYAAFNEKAVLNNKKKHSPDSPFLIGGVQGIDSNLLFSAEVQGKFF